MPEDDAAPGDAVEARIKEYRLEVNKNGRPTGSLANVMKALMLEESWRGVFRLDERSLQVAIAGSPAHSGEAPRALRDADFVWIATWLATEYLMNASKDRVAQVVTAIADRYAFDPVRDVLDSLVWDDRPRLDRWLVDCIGAEDSAYVRAVGRKWLISAVARTYEPGCQADSTLVLEGPQGIGKSSALRELVLQPDWLAEHLPDLSNKDAMLALGGPVILEFSELAALYRSNAVAIKSFLTRRVDRFRVPYGTLPIDKPRRCVFAATTNEAEYLRDETGNRRFWPVECGGIDLKRLAAEREQLWAEAVHAYKEGERWYITDDALEAEATRRQRERQQDDPWLEVVQEYVDQEESRMGREKVRIRIDDLFEQVGLDRGRWNQAARRRLADCLRQLGLERRTVREGVKTTRAFVFRTPTQDELDL